MKRVITLLTLSILLMTVFSSCMSKKASDESWVDLLEDGLISWKNTTGWNTGNEVSVDPSNEKELQILQPGKKVAIVETKSKADYMLTRGTHGDIEAHIEFMIPKGSNSGLYFMGRYEIQIFDSFGKKEISHSDCGGIYQRWGTHKDNGQAAKVNASTAPGTWQTYDIIFRAPRFDVDGKKTENAKFIKVVHNGQLIHKDAEVTGPTRSAMKEHAPEEPKGPMRIQGDHGPVAFRAFKIKHLSLE